MPTVWRASPVDWLARSYCIEEGARSVAVVEVGFGRRRDAIELDGRRFLIHREGFWHPTFLLTSGSDTVARGRSAGAFQRGFMIRYGAGEFRLDPSSFFSRSFDLSQHGRSLGQIRALGVFSRDVQIALDASLAPEVRLFAFWLVCIAWRRAAAVVAAT
jgi:hypothetical protein